jgi:hypothetical protein
VHTVALVLACALTLLVAGIITAVVINVTTHTNPTPTLGENTTQVLTGITGGLIGVLGSYVGYAMRHRGDYPPPP